MGNTSVDTEDSEVGVKCSVRCFYILLVALIELIGFIARYKFLLENFDLVIFYKFSLNLFLGIGN
jgi:hypothetical protein